MNINSVTIYNFCLKRKLNKLSLDNKIAFLEQEISELRNFVPISHKQEYNKGVILRDLQMQLASLNVIKQNDFIEDTTTDQNEEPIILITFKNKISQLSDALPKDKYGGNMLFCKALLKKLEELVEYIKENLETAKYATKIFELYIPEIINICENIPNKKADNFVDYMWNLNKVLSELDRLVDATTDKVLNFTDQDIEASFSVLIREMKNDKNSL